LYLVNAFSLNMLPSFEGEVVIKIKKLTLEEARTLLAGGFTSAVGHEDTARLLTGLLGVEVPFNRTGVLLTGDDEALVAQYRGPRLPEGATELPEGAAFEFFLVTRQ